MTNEQRRGYDNLLLLCGTRQTIIDNDVDQWTVAKLQNLMRAHEASGPCEGDFGGGVDVQQVILAATGGR